MLPHIEGERMKMVTPQVGRRVQFPKMCLKERETEVKCEHTVLRHPPLVQIFLATSGPLFIRHFSYTLHSTGARRSFNF